MLGGDRPRLTGVQGTPGIIIPWWEI
uniref:Uncharacterized protein n=1 Tax=Anguilla anguilla TaxID=7936 RepID=A0A0E9R3I7_ANGAN